MVSPVFSLLLSGAALVAILAKVVSMQGDIQRVADDRRLQQTEQANASATAILKALMNTAGGTPAIYPEPYIRSVAATPDQLAGKMKSTHSEGGVLGLDLTNGTWGVSLAGPGGLTPASLFRNLQVRPVDPFKTNPVPFFDGTGNFAEHSKVAAELVDLHTASANGLGPVTAAEFVLETSFKSSATKSIKPVRMRVKVDVPLPPAPRCELQAISGGKVQLLVDGVATTGRISVKGPPVSDIGFFEHSLSPFKPTPADSIYGTRRVILDVLTTEPVSNLAGSVNGPGGPGVCQGAPPSTTASCAQYTAAVIKLNRISPSSKTFRLDLDFGKLHERFPLWKHVEVSADGSVGKSSKVQIGPYAYSNTATPEYDDTYLRVTSFGNFNTGKQSRLLKMRSWPRPLDVVEDSAIEPLTGMVTITAELHQNMPVNFIPTIVIPYCSKLL